MFNGLGLISEIMGYLLSTVRKAGEINEHRKNQDTVKVINVNIISLYFRRFANL